ncbi:dynamin family protein [Bacillus sp. T33-2]|uniref:dynamin family protein n=1 Tax=Bacillus sp. T33-2 TaxID=2054168 RepID=UPI000C78243C|nr:dynamin family protein [Bacillus sp. T33-2]PLR99689.1 Dynamin family protein [Bacillus sp. T33-2]
MGQIVVQQDKQLIGKIYSLHNMFTANGDTETSSKTAELGKKAIEKEFSIAFCGHFSAGKSSMINRLAGADILPSSPIPTSANLVKVKSGEGYAKVFFKQGRPVLYPAPYDYEMVKSYCKDGDEIQAIEISHKGAGIPENVAIIDTPGIDSTDEAHRVSTESALHLADVIFYVMDYNHVQSELNFLFTKELTSAGKQLILVVNQIDKHREEELSFSQFKESVADAFKEWGVRPAEIFYTSLRDPDMPENQFAILQEFIKDRIAQRSEILPQSVFQSLQKLSDDHLEFLAGQHEAEAEMLNDLLKEVPEPKQKELPAKLEQIMNQLHELRVSGETIESSFDSGVESILKNAYLMPYETRALAEAYLQATQPGFKVGLLFASQKTKLERQARLDRFYEDLTVKVNTQLNWHIKEYLTKLLKEKDIFDPELMAKIQNYEIIFSKELLENLVKPGARLSGEYVLNFTADVAESIKKRAREQLFDFKKLYLEKAKLGISEEVIKLGAEHRQLKSCISAKEKLDLIEQKLAEHRQIINDILFGDAAPQVSEINAMEKFIRENVVPDIVKVPADVMKTAVHEEILEEISVPARSSWTEIAAHDGRLEHVIHKLNNTAREIRKIPGFKRIAADLVQQAERLEGREFTVALFGAFSAGKSSFANSLVGESILPVSPNPTTAAINRIKPVTDQHHHGTVLIMFKEAGQLLSEVNRSLKFFGLEAGTLLEAVNKIRMIKGGETFSPAEKTHLTFLQAFSRGLGPYEPRLGNVFSTDLETFRSFVSEEEKSCLVDWIEVYYDCELTRRGISLVDTPGADSINARHTGVAFDYIKNADAILFVTYYNHAFSKADREFLIQLGRVKDTFELDKMFFIVNAVDLANSMEEMQTVLAYVEDQLLKYGIRKPNMYPVSSLQALEEKTGGKFTGTSFFAEFEQDFYSFISNGLMELAVQSADAKWIQAVRQIENLIISSNEDLAAKQVKRAKMDEQQKAVMEVIKNQDPGYLHTRLLQETDELTHYIKQRVFFRFGDFFREAFHPSLLKDDGRNLHKALDAAMDDLLESLGYDLAQELRATTIRIDVFIGKILNEFQDSLSKEIIKIDHELLLSKWEDFRFGNLDFENAFQDIDPSMFKKALALFKNPKSFFEKNEKRLMADQLEKLLQGPADQYLQTESARLKAHYTSVMENIFKGLLDDSTEQIKEYYTGISSVLAEAFPVDQLKITLAEIKELG